MNKKLVVRNKFGKITYCVLDEALPYSEQLMQVLGITPGCGYSAEMHETKVLVRDYFVGETVGEFEILSFAETDLPLLLSWTTEGSAE